MLKEVVILFFTVFLNLSLKCQITLQISDLPEPGDVQISARVDSVEAVNLSPGSSGANMIWDFGMLNYYGSSLDLAMDSVLWVDPSSTAEAAMFPSAYIAQNTNCYQYHNWTTHVISWECYHNFCNGDTTGLHVSGSSYPFPHILQNSRNIFPLLLYGDTLTNISRDVIETGDTIRVAYIRDTSVADGWGTVYTPLDNFQALRIYTSETVWDSLYVNGVGQQIKFQAGNYYYRWYAKNVGFPVMQINKGILEKYPGFQIARFYYEKRYNAGISDRNIENDITRIIPNPFHDEAKIELKNQEKGEIYSLRIYDMTGRLVMVSENLTTDKIFIKRNNLPNGIYSYKITGNKKYYNKGKFVMN